MMSQKKKIHMTAQSQLFIEKALNIQNAFHWNAQNEIVDESKKVNFINILEIITEKVI